MTSPTHPKPRIESLSDLIFGLALSVGTISLIAKAPKHPADIISDVVQFGFSFIILISVWFRYTSVMSVLPVEDRTTMILNTIMLFLVAIEPYLFYLNTTFDLSQDLVLLDTASILYALDMAGLMAILALFTHQLTIEEKQLIPQTLLRMYRTTRTNLLVSSALFAVTILPVFWALTIQGMPLRFYVWFAPLILSSTRRISTTQKSRSIKLDRR
jgi:uncharacterized membrane protein